MLVTQTGGKFQPCLENNIPWLTPETVEGLHVQDNRGDTDSHLLPFLGTMSMDALMNGLRDIDYHGYFTFEVGGIFTPPDQKRPFEKDTRLYKTPLSLKRAAERYMYELGRCVLEAYGEYEE